jgi:DNA-binding NarL/FixJ family response regulator
VEKFINGMGNIERKMPEVIVVSNQSTQRESLDVVLRTLQQNGNHGANGNGNNGQEIGEIVFIDNLNAAITRMSEAEPFLMILDINEMDGQVENQLNQIKQQFSRVKLVVLADIAPWQTFKKMPGLDGLLLKGFSSIQLTKMIRTLLDPGFSLQPDGPKEKK